MTHALWEWIDTLGIALVAAAVTAIVVRWLLARPPGSRWSVMDVPNERSLHSQPVPRAGGLGVVAGALAVMGWQALTHSGALAWPAAGVLLVGAVSLRDDYRHVHPVIRLATHTLAGWLAIEGASRLAGVQFPWAVWILLVPAMVWCINLYNFMDGMDGFAASMTAFGFGGLALLATLGAGRAAYVHVMLAIAVAGVAFLGFNRPPARIFLGDVGSAPLGLLMGVGIVWGVAAHQVPLASAIFVFSPFWLDATVTLVARAARGKPVWQAHREHYYQRLVALGFSHGRVLAIEGLLMVASLVAALWVARDAALTAPAAIVLVVLYTVAGARVHHLERRAC